MPVQVVVVKRPRRGAFAILRSVPAWLRAVVATARSIGRGRTRIEFEGTAASKGSGILASERLSGVLWPGPVAKADLEGCADCGRCVAVCPCQALRLEFSGPASLDTQAPAMDVDVDMDVDMDAGMDAGPGEIRFDLDPGRCIGCGDCARVCPSDLLEMQVRASRIGEGACPPWQSLVQGGAPSVGS